MKQITISITERNRQKKKLDEIEDDSVNWITRQQMEGQTVFNIDQNYFIWKITESPIKYKEINFD